MLASTGTCAGGSVIPKPGLPDANAEGLAKLIAGIGFALWPPDSIFTLLQDEGAAAEVTQKVQAVMATHWDDLKYHLFEKPFVFREDEVLDEEEIALTRAAIQAYNATIKGRFDSKANVILFPADEILAEAGSQGGYIPKSAAGTPLLLESEGRRGLFATLNGGVFSFDGVHPSKVGHAALALEIAKLMRARAEARSEATGDKVRQFGGVDMDALVWSVWMLEYEVRSAYDNDPVIKSAKGLDRWDE